jgi:hypothetical protein
MYVHESAILMTLVKKKMIFIMILVILIVAITHENSGYLHFASFGWAVLPKKVLMPVAITTALHSPFLITEPAFNIAPSFLLIIL